jgi:hypothetical protein
VRRSNCQGRQACLTSNRFSIKHTQGPSGVAVDRSGVAVDQASEGKPDPAGDGRTGRGTEPLRGWFANTDSDNALTPTDALATALFVVMVERQRPPQGLQRRVVPIGSALASAGCACDTGDG